MEDLKRNGSAILYDKLSAYGKSDYYPYHMPGHKRSQDAGVMSDFFGIDITEIDGFDNLHHAQGILRDVQSRAAKLYESEETYFLVNGSTCGVLAAISAVTDRQDSILIARNCHKSVYHAAFLRELSLRYLYPDRIAAFDIPDALSPEQVEAALDEYPECQAVVVTSPTYEGIVADIRGICEAVHSRNKILIVDEAHGAHFGLAEGLPENSVKSGADIVIHSLHKTLPSMTQTALLHVNGPRINRKKLRRYLRIYQSSSPSYVLMAGMDACISYVMQNGPSCFERLQKHYREFMARTKQCAHIRIGSAQTLQDKEYHGTAWDICKLVISVKGTFMSGQELYDILREEYHLQMEMAADSYVLAIMTVADKEEGWQRLADALLRIDDRIEKDNRSGINSISGNARRPDRSVGFCPPEVRLTLSQAIHAADEGGKAIPLSEADGKVAGDFINLYPPGVPLLVPGEVISAEALRRIEEYLELGLQVQGVSKEGSVIIC